MPLNHSLWRALWDRAAREEIGIVCKFTDASSAKWQLNQNRPEGFSDFTLCKISDPEDLILILRPGVTLNDESDAHAARQIFSDLE